MDVVKKVVYTAIYGNYDQPLKPIVDNPEWDHILFTDNSTLDSNIWQKVIMKPTRPFLQSRYVKLLYHSTIINKYDLILWIDANILIRCDLNEFAEKNPEEFVLLKHPDRDNIAEEARVCIKLKKDHASKINNQVEKYRKVGYKFDNGLAATGIMLRRNTDNVKQFCLKWWEELASGSIRDQLSFNYVLWKHPIDVKFLNWKETFSNEFHYRPHKRWQKQTSLIT